MFFQFWPARARLGFWEESPGTLPANRQASGRGSFPREHGVPRVYGETTGSLFYVFYEHFCHFESCVHGRPRAAPLSSFFCQLFFRLRLHIAFCPLVPHLAGRKSGASLTLERKHSNLSALGPFLFVPSFRLIDFLVQVPLVCTLLFMLPFDNFLRCSWPLVKVPVPLLPRLLSVCWVSIGKAVSSAVPLFSTFIPFKFSLQVA